MLSSRIHIQLHIFYTNLGEEKFSFGYDSQGKFYNAGEIQDLETATYEKGDVLGTFLVRSVNIALACPSSNVFDSRRGVVVY
jgi:hypothetical protein